LKVMRDGHRVTVEARADGDGVVSHAGSALVALIADKSGLTGALSMGLAGLLQRRAGHDPGRVVRDLAVMLADGGDCLADLGAVRDQDALFGSVASDSTAFRVIDQIAVVEAALEQIPAEHIEDVEIVVRADSAGATHDLLAFCREHRLRYAVGFELSEAVRAAILKVPEEHWIASLATDGSPRPQRADRLDHRPSGPRLMAVGVAGDRAS